MYPCRNCQRPANADNDSVSIQRRSYIGCQDFYQCNVNRTLAAKTLLCQPWFNVGRTLVAEAWLPDFCQWLLRILQNAYDSLEQIDMKLFNESTEEMSSIWFCHIGHGLI